MVRELEPKSSQERMGWLTASEAAEAIGVTGRTILSYLSRGTIAGVKVRHKKGTMWLINPESVENYIMARNVPQGVDGVKLRDIAEIWRMSGTRLRPMAEDMNCPERCAITCNLDPYTSCPDWVINP